MFFLLGKKRKRFHQHCPKTALAETFGERRKNCSLNAFVKSSACVCVKLTPVTTTFPPVNDA